jgi:DNA replication licensing factor MCM2
MRMMVKICKRMLSATTSKSR